MSSEESLKKQPNIFEYYDYREYLRDRVAFERERTPVFSNRYIVQKAGFKSPTALKHVIDGKRNLSLESANKFAGALKIEGIQRHYFLTLVLFNQASTIEEREKYLNELTELKRSETPSHIEEAQFEILSKWYHLVIREVVNLPDFKNSSKWISRVLMPQISPREAADSIQLLKLLGLIEKRDGKYYPVDKTLTTDERVRSIKVLEYHRQMIQNGSESMVRFRSDEREISGTTLCMNSEDVQNIKKLIREFNKKVLNIAANSVDSDQIYQLNFQFFPLVLTDRKSRQFDDREDICSLD
jgi:uncharacterized protein (TIGR02147 family)